MLLAMILLLVLQGIVIILRNLHGLRTGEFPEEQLSVYVTARRYGSLDTGETMTEVLHRLDEICREIVDNHVMHHVLFPLQQTISTK